MFQVFASNSFSDKFSYEYIYPTTHDAVLTILRRNKINKIRLISKKNQSFYINLIDTTGTDNTSTASIENITGIDTDKDEQIIPKYIHRGRSNLFDDIALKINPQFELD